MKPKDVDKGPAGKELSKMESENKDCLMFHGVIKDDMEKETADIEIRKNLLDHNIKNLLLNEWGIECRAPFKHVFRWGGGPRVNGAEPVLVIFEDKREKDQVWSKLRDNLIARTSIMVTQDSSNNEKETTSQNNRALRKTSKKMSNVKTDTKRGDSPIKKGSLSGRESSTSESSEQKSFINERKSSKSSLVCISPKTLLSNPVSNNEQEEEEDNYGELNASLSVILHGIEFDWIEEDMLDDDDFRKYVLEQKVKKVLEDIGLTKKIGYKKMFRWVDGPIHNCVLPVVVEFEDENERNEVYNVCKEGLKNSTWVITEDSRSRLGGQKPKEVSSKLNFCCFMDHYQSYSTAQALYNKMVRLL